MPVQKHSKIGSKKRVRQPFSKVLRLHKIAWVLVCCAAPLASAQQLVDISSCARITDDKQRFACYDELARAAGALPAKSATATVPAVSAPVVAPVVSAGTASGAASVTPAGAATPTPAGAATPAKPAAAAVTASTDAARIAAFGSASQARIEAGKNGQEMLVDTVTAVKLYQQNTWQLGLSSGQVWRQMIPRPFLLRVGDKVHIVPNPWGNSFRLSVEGRDGFIQVEKLVNK